MKLRRKEEIVDAIQWTGTNVDEVVAFLGLETPHPDYPYYRGQWWRTGWMDVLSPGGWLVKATHGFTGRPWFRPIAIDDYEAVE